MSAARASRVGAVVFLSLLIFGVHVCFAGTAAEAYGPGWEGLPDWRGVWHLQGPLLFSGPQGAVIAKGSGAAKAADHGVTPGSYFTGAPYKPEYRKLYEERVASALKQRAVKDPVDNCHSPHGMPRLMGAGPGALEFFVTPGRTWIIWDALNQTRRIYTDGRGHPGEDQRWARTMGHSIGHWEKQTLVVDTVMLMPGIYDRSEAPYSDRLHITERISLTDAKTITDEMTLEDPVMFTQPWRLSRRFIKSDKQWENVRGTYCEYVDPQPIRAE